MTLRSLVVIANLCLAAMACADAPTDRVSVSLGEFSSLYDGRARWTHAARFEEAVARSKGAPLSRAPLHLRRISSDGKIRFFYRSRLRSNGDAPVGVQVEVFRQQSERGGEWERIWSSKTELAEEGASEGDEVSPIFTVPVGFGAAPVAAFRVIAKSYAGNQDTQPVEATFSLAFPSRFYVPLSEQVALEPSAIWMDANVSRSLYEQLRQSLQQFRENRAAPRANERPTLIGPAFSPDTVQASASLVERLRDVAAPGAPQRTNTLGDVGGSLASLKNYLRVAAVAAPRTATADNAAMQVFNRKYLEALTAVDALTGDDDGSLSELANATRPYFVAAVGGNVSTDYAPLQKQLWAVIGNVARVQQALSIIGDYALPVTENRVLVVKPARANFAPAASAFGDFFLRVVAHLAVLTAFYERMDTRAQGDDLAACAMPPSPEQLVITVGNNRPNDAGLHRLSADVQQVFSVTADGQPMPNTDVSLNRVTVRGENLDAPEPIQRRTDARGRVAFTPEVGGYWMQAEKEGYISALLVFEALPTPTAQRPPDAPRALPDLIVTNIQTNGNPAFLLVRQPTWLFARVANVGRGDAQGPIDVVFEAKRGTSPLDPFEMIGVATVPRTYRIVGMRSGTLDRLTVRTDWVPPAPGDYTLRVTVNPNRDGHVEPLEESDFRNNSYAIVVRVGGANFTSALPNTFSLAVTQIVIVPAQTSLSLAQPVTLAVRVRNVGGIAIPCSNLCLRLSAAGALVTEHLLPCWTVNGFERNYLAPGEEALITGLRWTPTVVGHVPLVAEIVPLNALVGVTFANRSYTTYCDVLQPSIILQPRLQRPNPFNPLPQRDVDLAISSADIVLRPAEPRPGESVRVTVTIPNRAETDIASIIVRASISSAGSSQTAVQFVRLIRRGGAASITLTLLAPHQVGRYTVFVEVSLRNGIDLNRTNNTASLDFRVRPAGEEKARSEP
jgi:hypothetical protein